MGIAKNQNGDLRGSEKQTWMMGHCTLQTTAHRVAHGSRLQGAGRSGRPQEGPTSDTAAGGNSSLSWNLSVLIILAFIGSVFASFGKRSCLDLDLNRLQFSSHSYHFHPIRFQVDEKKISTEELIKQASCRGAVVDLDVEFGIPQFQHIQDGGRWQWHLEQLPSRERLHVQNSVYLRAGQIPCILSISKYCQTTGKLTNSQFCKILPWPDATVCKLRPFKAKSNQSAKRWRPKPNAWRMRS